MGSSSILRVLVPRGAWLWRTVLLLGFIFLDFLVTVLLCDTPYAEANLFARSFMQTYGIVNGLVVFDLLLSAPIYAILVIDSYLIKYTGQFSTIAELFVDITLGWLIAGAHFNGAASWLWDAPQIMRQTLGFAFYLAIVLPAFYLNPKPVLPRSLSETNVQQNEESLS
jgi:hypothetical protein